VTLGTTQHVDSDSEQSGRLGSGPRFGRFSLARGLPLATLLLCLPVILGTGVLVAGVLSEPFQDHSQFDPFRFREPTAADWLREHVLWPIWLSSFLGAAYGPMLIPFAGTVALVAARQARPWSRSTLRLWAPVVLALLATATFWIWLVHLELLP
jgi:hypothetical protein